MRLLTVDWDYFFPNPMESGESDPYYLYDWGHREAPFFVGPLLWNIRAGAFAERGLPLPGTSGEELNFWSHFEFAPKAKLFVSDSHACAGTPEVASGATEIWNLDAHHDFGYGPVQPGGQFDCGDWLRMVEMLTAARVRVRYPRWKPKALAVDRAPAGLDAKLFDPAEKMPVFDRLHICRSGAWSPTWLDEQFVQFVYASGLTPRRVEPDLANPMAVRDQPPVAAELSTAGGVT